MRRNDWITLVIWILLFQIIGFFLGQLTQANLYPWYSNLEKSLLTPTGIVFSIVWTFLYALLALIAWILSNRYSISSRKMFFLFMIQMIMNWIWTILFFHFHWILFSALWLITLTGLNFILIIQSKHKDKIIAFLLAPYVLWLSFASYLNIFIAKMN